MIKPLLKLWSSNAPSDFAEAAKLCATGIAAGVELYNNVSAPLSYDDLKALQGIVVGIHHPHSHGWHDNWMLLEQEMHWEQTRALADFFGATCIVVHPARTHTENSFFSEAERLRDPRVHIENMAGLDIDSQEMQWGNTVLQLQKIVEAFPICFDFEKAVKAARRFGIPYKEYITTCLDTLRPNYFHVSGGDTTSAADQHLSLWEGDIDTGWIRRELEARFTTQDCFVVFEVPKERGLDNDIKNIDYFKNA